MAEERMKHRIWADEEPGGWAAHFQTSRGIRRLGALRPTKEAALIAAGQAMCEALDQQEILVTVTPPRKSKEFTVSRVFGKRNARLSAVR